MDPTGARAPFVLITAARNEVAVIDRTIASVASQDPVPGRWVIVSDGSTDGTDHVVRGWSGHLPWLRLVHVDRSGPAGFRHKAAALELAYREAAEVPHEAVGHLDADVELPGAYFARCLAALDGDPELGIVGGAVVEVVGRRERRQRSDRRSVAGAAQVFRRACWDAIGRGYLPMDGGGEDAVAEVLARLAGYEVRCLPDLTIRHDGPVLGGARTTVGARFRRGQLHWRLGHRLLFELAAAVYRVTEPPVVLGSVATVAGYGRAALGRWPRSAPPHVVEHIRSEQSARLHGALGAPWSEGRAGKPVAG